MNCDERKTYTVRVRAPQVGIFLVLQEPKEPADHIISQFTVQKQGKSTEEISMLNPTGVIGRKQQLPPAVFQEAVP